MTAKLRNKLKLQTLEITCTT